MREYFEPEFAALNKLAASGLVELCEDRLDSACANDPSRTLPAGTWVLVMTPVAEASEGDETQHAPRRGNWHQTGTS